MISYFRWSVRITWINSSLLKIFYSLQQVVFVVNSWKLVFITVVVVLWKSKKDYIAWKKLIRIKLRKPKSDISLRECAPPAPSPPPPPVFCSGSWASDQIFKKGALDKISIFRGRLLEKRGVTFFRGGCSFYVKNKLKSEIFNNI